MKTLQLRLKSNTDLPNQLAKLANVRPDLILVFGGLNFLNPPIWPMP